MLNPCSASQVQEENHTPDYIAMNDVRGTNVDFSQQGESR